jgi:TonB family protein
MNRLHKKCFIASAGTHLLLMLILFIGPAFLSAKNPKSEDFQLLDFVPPRTVDALVAANPGGAPVQRQQQQQPPAQSQPVQESKPPPAQKAPEPPNVVDKKEPESFEVKPQKPRLPQINTTLTKRPSTNKQKQTEKPTDKTDNREREAAENRRNTAAAIARATANLDKGLSASTSVRIGDGDGRGSGPAYANFLQLVKSVYTRMWDVPDGASDGAIISVSVTIARNGDVVRSSITHRSGDSIADASVELLLDRVQHVAPLPEDSKDDQRTVHIDFSVKAAKRLLG